MPEGMDRNGMRTADEMLVCGFSSLYSLCGLSALLCYKALGQRMFRMPHYHRNDNLSRTFSKCVDIEKLFML